MGWTNPNGKLFGSLVLGGNVDVFWQNPRVMLPAVAGAALLLVVWVLLASKTPVTPESEVGHWCWSVTLSWHWG